MLTVAKVTARVAGGYADYLEGKTRTTDGGDYYLKDGERVEAPGRWIGMAETVGADRSVPVTGRELRELMAVRHPVTGQALRRVGPSGEAVAAIDATFSAPKSVSAVWALADPQLRSQIEQAHEHAIDRAMAYSTQRVAMVRERVDKHRVVHVTATGVVASSWRHTTARVVTGRAPDPQLHSHVLLHAAVRADGKVVAIDSRAWLLHRREIGAAYRTELALGLTRLGFEIERGTGRGGRYFEIKGIPQPLLDTWSSRHQQVREEIKQRLLAKGADPKHGQLSPAEERLASVKTRQGKQPVTTADLDHAWRQDADRAGIDQAAVRDLQRAGGREQSVATTGELVSALTEFDATFTQREARAVALERSAGTPIEAALETLDQARADRQVLTLADGRLTTGLHRGMERTVLTTGQRLVAERGEPIDAATVERSAEAVNSRLADVGGALSDEQRHALDLTAAGRQLVMIEGQAGTGKSTVLQAVALAQQAAGREVIVTSTAGLAAQRLATDLADAGVQAPAYSTAALKHAIDKGDVQLSPETTVINDEAALASTREQHQLFSTIQQTGAQLVLVGDPRQSKPVGAGGLWPRLQTAAGQDGAVVQLTQNLRARDPDDRRDQQLFREGEHEQAVRGYAQRNRVRSGGDQHDIEASALYAAHKDRQSGKDTLVIAQTSNDHLDELNAHAQALRLADGELGHDNLPVAGRPYDLHGGDRVQIRHTVTLPDQVQLRNGTSATVTGIDPVGQTARLRLDDDAELQLDKRTLEQADVRLAYVQHPFPAQGATSDTAHLIVSDHTTKEGAYVAITRARDRTDIYASWDALTADTELEPLPRLAEILGRSEPDIPSIATPLAEPPTIKPPHAPAPERQQAIERDDDGWEI